MLTSAEITKLVASGGKKRRKSTAKNRWFNGTEWISGKPPLESNVHFEGRVGTRRKTRKGGTAIKPNGSRYLVGQYGDQNVLAYITRP